MTREELREGWVKAWTKFYSYPSMFRRFHLSRNSSWIQAAGFWPLNLMQHRLAHSKIEKGMQRFRSGVAIEDDPISLESDAFPYAGLAATAGPRSPIITDTKLKHDPRKHLPVVG